MEWRRWSLICAMLLQACSPEEPFCSRIADVPSCTEPVALEVVDPLGLPAETIAGVAEHSGAELHDRVGMYVTGDGAFYDGALEFVDDHRGEVLVTDAAYAVIAMTVDRAPEPDAVEFVLLVGDFIQDHGIALGQREGEDMVRVGILQELPGAGIPAYPCGSAPVSLGERPAAIRLDDLSCDDDDPDTSPRLRHVSVDLSRRPLDSIKFDDIVRANALVSWSIDIIGQFARCGDGWLLERQTTYKFNGERGQVYVDYRATWYVKDRCPATHGVAQIQIEFAEECWCPDGGHCHGRYDEDCVPYD